MLYPQKIPCDNLAMYMGEWPNEKGIEPGTTSAVMLVDYSVDRNPSGSGIAIRPMPKGTRFYLTVRGLGVIVIDTSCDYEDPKGRPVPESADMITRSEIGPCPDLGLPELPGPSLLGC